MSIEITRRFVICKRDRLDLVPIPKRYLNLYSQFKCILAASCERHIIYLRNNNHFGLNFVSKILIGGIYRPPDSNSNHWLLLEHSINQAFSQTCDTIIVTGDFSINIMASQSNTISKLMTSHAEQLIDSRLILLNIPCSLIDLIIVQRFLPIVP